MRPFIFLTHALDEANTLLRCQTQPMRIGYTERIKPPSMRKL